MPKFKGAVNSKLPKTGTTIFTVMSKLAQEHNALNLSQGFPNFNPDVRLLELVQKHMAHGHNQYAPMPGVMALREAIARKTQKLYGTTYDPETEVTVTSGATQAIYTAITALVREGDEVIIFSPAYDCYQPAVELAGGKPVFLKLKLPDYTIDWNAVRKLLNHHTRMIIINSPHNPTGSILKPGDLQELEKITRDSDIIILSDEVYEHIVFDGEAHLSLAANEQLRTRSIITSSFGKTYHTTGWKIGYVVGPENLMKEFRKVHQYIVFSANTPLQHAFAEFMDEEDNYTGLSAFYQKKRDFFAERLQGSRFSLLKCQGSYFQLLGYKDITDERDTDYAVRLVKENGIASVPISVFYNTKVDNKILRFCFAKDDETLEKAAEILRKI